MERIAVLVASSPTSASAQRAFGIAAELAGQGHQVTLGLLEDAVLAATGRVGGVTLATDIGALVLAPDLTLRGISPKALLPTCRVCAYGDLVDLMLEQSDRTLGVF